MGIWTRDFNPRSPYGERHKVLFPLPFYRISIHAPLTGGATWMSGLSVLVSYISIHAPLTGSDRVTPDSFIQEIISIHAPLRGATLVVLGISNSRDFNPRSPYGERLPKQRRPKKTNKFQSTLPLRGATAKRQLPDYHPGISIHAPLTGSDFFCQIISRSSHPFQSTPLTGSDLRRMLVFAPVTNFNPRSPLRGATEST